MNDVLIVLNPRRITDCLSSIRALNIDKVWIRNLSEPQIEDIFTSAVLPLLSGYDRAFIVSDDTTPHQPALDLLRAVAAPVVTGYCNLAVGDMRVNLCPKLGEVDTSVHYTLDQVQRYPAEFVPTSFTGFALTGMPVEMWRRYPYKVMPGGWGADESLSRRLLDDGVRITAHRSAFVWHVKERWSEPDQDPEKRLYVGVEPSKVDLERMP